MTFQLHQYDITLKRVERSDIELIRKWRNHPEIRSTMSYRRNISASQQEKWFDRVNNKLNYYFLIIVDGSYIGVINCKEVNLQEEYGEGGIFIWDENYLNTPYPVFASIILLDFIFNVLKIGDKSFVRVLPENGKAIAYNRGFGYALVPGQEAKMTQWYVLTKGTYNLKAEKYRVASKNFTKTDGRLTFGGVASDRNLEKINALLK